MGTHPIFESDFDCLTGSKLSIRGAKMSDRLMIDLKQIGAIQENYLKERWIRMNWRKNYRLKQKTKH